jgi:RNA polymerase sigma factor (sigma-70 family)
VSEEGAKLPAEWSEITRRVERFVERFFRGRHEIDPADVTQDVLLHLLGRFLAGSVIDDPVAFALAIARRRAIDALRRSYASRRFLDGAQRPDSMTGTGNTSLDDPMEQSEVRAIIQGLRVRLTPRCRVILDQLLLGLRLAEAASALGATAGAVRNRWFYCRRQILEALDAWGLQRSDLLG